MVFDKAAQKLASSLIFITNNKELSFVIREKVEEEVQKKEEEEVADMC